MINSGKACIGCAKIKVKCDKVLPRCGRCVRLGIDCHTQARRRGRPSKASVSAAPNKNEQSHEKSDANQNWNVAVGPKKAIIIEYMKMGLRKMTEDGNSKGAAAVTKCAAVAKWLGHIACSMNSKESHEEIDDILKMFNGESLDSFEERALLTQHKSGETRTPSYISSMNCDGSAFLVRHCIDGSSLFLTNENMTKQIVSSEEINSIFVDSGGDPVNVLKQVVDPRDESDLITAMRSLIINPNLNSETSLLINCRNRNSDHSTTLALCQLRLSLSANGRHFCSGIKLTPLPIQSPYIINPSVINGNHSSSSSSNVIENGDTGVNGYLGALLDDPNGDLEEDSQSHVLALQSPQPQTRELLFHQEQQTESWNHVHPPGTSLSLTTEPADIPKRFVVPNIGWGLQDGVSHMEEKSEHADTFTTCTVNIKRKTYSSNSEGSSTKLPHYEHVSRGMNRRSIETYSDEKAETKRSSPPQQLGFDQVNTFDAIDYQNMAESTADLEEFLELF